jgi:hypothetical protein
VSLALAATAIVLCTLLWQLALPSLRGALTRVRGRNGVLDAAPHPGGIGYDPGRELRAEQRARRLLRSCVNQEEWAMYHDLGFLRVWGTLSSDPATATATAAAAGTTAAGTTARQAGSPANAVSYAYLIYPHLPIVAYLPQTGRLLGEYCIAFPNHAHSSQHGAPRLPDADDVLAKWLLLTASERHAIAEANMHLPGRQIPAARLRHDLACLARWERERLARSLHGAGSVPAS